ncbi:MAG: hypothetical protein JXM79_04235 [Sedimentisphaerales bacterium]|nr:hypothetical protein [Sedimentisphaerales bacterium]
MSGWRSKLIFMLIIYCAGFATAIYTLAPTPEGSGYASLSGFVRPSEKNTRITQGEFVESFNTGMHKCVEFGKEAACRTAKSLKKKIQEMREEK